MCLSGLGVVLQKFKGDAGFYTHPAEVGCPSVGEFIEKKVEQALGKLEGTSRDLKDIVPALGIGLGLS